MSSLPWMLSRLRLMTAVEVMWRVQALLKKNVCKLGIGLVTIPPIPDLTNFGKGFIGDAPIGLDDRSLFSAADAVLAGSWTVFSKSQIQLGFPPEWNRDPKTGTRSPIVLGKAIDYRDERIVGDIKYLWEPSRHLELVTLALAWRVSRQQCYADGARVLLQSWFEQCPYPCGVHWTSALELAIRLLNWAVAWELLGGHSSPLFEGHVGQRFLRQWLDAVFQHCHFIRGYFSRHSSANNHLFGEYMGLFVASLTWPCWPESTQWMEIGRRGLEEEALKQNTPDGVNKEQAIYYQHEVMDMMLLCHLAGKANGVLFSSAYLARLEKLAEFLASLMDVGGHVPMIGDSDDAKMVRLAYANDWCHYRSLLASCAILFSRPDFKVKARVFDDKNKWLFGDEGLAKWEALASSGSKSPRRAFSNGGYWIIGDNFDTAEELRIAVDAAPLGYLSIAAHGHADALSLTLSLGGEPFLIDPGTFAYHTQQRWRDYFRGTSAHNTVRVDGLNQSTIGGSFMWLQKANAKCEEWISTIDSDQFVGSHDGFERLADKVTHRRTIRLDKKSCQIAITDRLECKDNHEVELFWHFAPECNVRQEDLLVVATRAKRTISFGFSGMACNASLFRGDDALPLGWVSERFDEKVPATTLRRTATISGTTEFITNISY